MRTRSPEIVLQELIEGNQRYVAGQLLHPRQTPEYRRALRDHQSPIACVLGCADSRVPPEILFDQGLGDLFVVRVAGNVVDDVVIGSLEYAVLHLQTPLLMVLGHTGCGAVRAAMEAMAMGKEGEGHLKRIVEAIRPAIIESQPELNDRLERAIHMNIRRSVRELLSRGLAFSSLVQEGQLKIVGAWYDLESGRVEVLEEIA
ncbi:MAG: carbonic anhydrase [Anaerolineae bacterium]|nr:carbonic anhydrase [Thermoflexus sp.]MDW8064857.1 carbonic anhydrase [Anaerolineae bacterium]